MVSKTLALTAPKQQQGKHFEQLASDFLQQQGLILIAQNWCQAKVGELDLVMLEQGQTWDTLVFVEVRQRKPSQFGDALASITKTKQQKLIKTAQYFLQANPQYVDCECRFDVVGFVDGLVAPEWLQGAFMA